MQNGAIYQSSLPEIMLINTSFSNFCNSDDVLIVVILDSGCCVAGLPHPLIWLCAYFRHLEDVKVIVSI